MEHIDTYHSPGRNTFFALIAILFKLIAGLTISDIMNYVFTGLSIISVIMMIVINWTKFTTALKKKKTTTDE